MKTSVTSELTKGLIADSLKDLLAKKPLDKISVREITEHCGVNRQTFYYHFRDIYDLLEYILRKELISVIDDTDKFLTWQDAGIYLLRFLQQNSVITTRALNSLGISAIKQFLYDDIRSIASQYIMQVSDGIKVNPADMEHVIHFYATSFSALLEDWIAKGMQKTPEELIELLETIVSGSAKAALERFAAKESAL